MVSVDRDGLSETWAEWEATASAKWVELRRLGVDVQKVEVDVEELRAWCKRHERPLDGRARSAFVVEPTAAARAGAGRARPEVT